MGNDVNRTGQVWRFLTGQESFVAVVVDISTPSPHANSQGYYVMHPIVMLDDAASMRYIRNRDSLGRPCLEESKLVPWEQQPTRKSRIA